MHALKEIKALSLPQNEPFYYHYPAMKQGHLPAVDFFAQFLGAKALEILTKDRNEHKNKKKWLITTPAYYQLPAAANLLARKVHNILTGKGFTTSLTELRLNTQSMLESAKQEYSKSTLKQRINARQHIQQLLSNDLALHFKGKSVLVINDINVTGTQQNFIQKTLNAFGAKEVQWLYIFNLDKELAKSNPEIEYQLNNCCLNDLDSYIKIITDHKTQHTARCIERFFNQDINNFHYLVNEIGSNIRKKLYWLAQIEVKYNGNFYAEKMKILANSINASTT